MPISKYRSTIFQERLKAMRKRKGLSKEMLGDFVGVTGNAIGMYERGEKIPSVGNLVALAEFFGASTDYILGISDVP